MAIKERLLKQLNNVQDGLRAMPPFHSRDLQAMRNALLQARDLCFRGLSEKHFANYQDTYDGLLLAIDQLAAGAPDAGEIVSLCSELLQFMMMQTQKENAFKKEIFFLPYKASMWDSLESVWKAADKDKEHCIAYVMPIPYADLTPEHTVAEWHCERDQFPKDVPTVKWEDFNLKEIHPDVIFIHNPYDGNNYVTSVESRYYSSVLKDQTDKLVYIPYFVLAEPELDGKSEEEIEIIEEGIEHFITTPAVLNAHQVIVQSEAMRRVYVNVLTRKMDITDRAFWEKRILGMGSPKFDKVAMTKKEELDIPDEWMKIIQKPDGSWKKIVFYNTGLSAMLQHNEKMLVKIRQAFQTFQENQDEVALLWRPHPLLQATLKSMRPELVEEYDRIVRRYKAEGWGIYDDSADMDRAVTLSDAYFGDGSSVVQLYEQTGKPIYIQNPSHNQRPLFSRNISVRDGGKAYLVDGHYGIIHEIDIEIGACKKQIPIPLQYITTVCSYVMVEDVGDKLIILPEQENNILEYDKTKREFRVALTLEQKHSMSSYSIFSSAIAFKGKRFFISYQQGEIVKYDEETDSYTLMETHWRVLQETLSKEEYQKHIESGWLGYALEDQNILMIPIVNTNIIMFLDMDTDSVCVQYLNDISNIQRITRYENDFYFLLTSGRIVSCHYTSGRFEDNTREIYSHNSATSAFPFYFLENIDERLVLLPGTCGKEITMNANDGTVIESKETDQIFGFTQMVDGKKWIAFSSGDTGNYIYILAGFNRIRSIEIMSQPDYERVKHIARIVIEARSSKVISEIMIPLEIILENVINSKDLDAKILSNSATGRKIYEEMSEIGAEA